VAAAPPAGGAQEPPAQPISAQVTGGFLRLLLVAIIVAGGVVAFGAFAWSEIQRRLVNLNHENARILAAQSASVSADTYTANEQQRRDETVKLDEWRKDVDRDRAKTVTREEFLRDTKTEKRAGIDTTTKVVGAFIAACVLGLALLNYQALHADTKPPTIVVNVPKQSTP